MKIGIVLPQAQREDGSHPRYRELRDVAQRADSTGLDAIWVFDHLFFRFPDEPTAGIWEAWTTLAAVCEATQRVEVGSIVLCTEFRNPAVLAKMADTADEISGGRLILGLGAGWHEPEFEAFGIPTDHRYGRFEESLTIISGLLRHGRVDFEGRFHSARDCELVPRGPRPGGPPILVAARGPKMLRLTARTADAWNAAWFGRPTRYIPRRDELVAACVAEGRDPATLEFTAGLRIDFGARADDAPAPDPDAALPGSVDAIADAFATYEALGCGQVICALEPATVEAVDSVAEAADRYRRSRSVAGSA